jgi:hypothetical protein
LILMLHCPGRSRSSFSRRFPGTAARSAKGIDFDRANEKAFGIGLRYDFGGTLLSFQIPGLSLHMIYAYGTDRVNPTTGGGLPTTREGNLDIIYNVPAVKGLSLRFRNAYGHDGGPKVFKDFRLIINYDLDLL